MNTAFPTTECRKADWRPFIMSAMEVLGGGDVKFNDIIDHIGGLPGFPGWHVWGDYNGKANQMGRRFVSLEATAMKKEGLLTSPCRGTYRLASETAIEPAPEPAVVHRAVLTVVPDPEPEIVAPEPVEAPVEAPKPVEVPVAEGPTTHPLYLSSERARRVAVEQTRCFGFYSERAPTCGDCPLAGLCFAARGGKVAEANARAEDARVEANARAEDARVEAERVEAERVEAERVEAERVVSGTVIQLPFAIVCSGCGEKTEPFTDVVAVEGVGSFHMGCAPSAV